MPKRVRLYGKQGCGLCAAAAQKLDLLGVPYQKVDLDEVDRTLEGWRENDVPAALAFYSLSETLPVISVNEEFMTYPEAMKRLRGR